MTNATEPLVSIIVPCFKQAGFLGQTLLSVLAQTWPRVEAIVVDDGSPDDCAAVAAQFGTRVAYVRRENGGPAAARNTGIAKAQGDYFIFLDGDDLLYPRAVEHHLEVVRANGGDCVTWSGWDDIDPDGNLLARHEAPLFAPDPFHALLPTNFGPPACVLVPRSALDRCGIFEPARSLQGSEDWELWLRLASGGVRFVPVSAPLARYRHWPGSISRNQPQMYRSAMLVVRKYRNTHARCGYCKAALARALRHFRALYVSGVLRSQIGKAAIAPIVSGLYDALSLDPMLASYIVRAGGRVALRSVRNRV